MKIIYQFFDFSGNIEALTIFSTVSLLISFAGIVVWAYMLSKKHLHEMSQSPLDKEIFNQ